MARGRRPIDWEEALKWLEMGYQMTDLAMMMGFSRAYFSRRATEDLNEEQKKRWKKALNRTGECGTRAGYCRHQRRKEKPCDPCFEAQSVYAAWYWKNRGKELRDRGKAARAKAEREEGPGSARGD